MLSLVLQPHTTLQHIRTAFHQVFPYLQLQFFNASHQPDHGNTRHQMITDHQLHLGDITTRAMDITFHINEHTTVLNLETMFEQELHAHIQVFTRSGNLWLETVHTDGYTLVQLNQKAELRNQPLANTTEAEDYHEQP